eukprot:5896417-Prymnesium_polylepis.2
MHPAANSHPRPSSSVVRPSHEGDDEDVLNVLREVGVEDGGRERGQSARYDANLRAERRKVGACSREEEGGRMFAREVGTGSRREVGTGHGTPTSCSPCVAVRPKAALMPVKATIVRKGPSEPKSDLGTARRRARPARGVGGCGNQKALGGVKGVKGAGGLGA